MNLTELEARFSAQRSAMLRDSPTPNAAAPAGSPTFRKADLVGMLCDRVGLNGREAREMVEAFFEVMSGALGNGETVKLSGFGCFQLREKRSVRDAILKPAKQFPSGRAGSLRFMQATSSSGRLKLVANSVAVTDRKRPTRVVQSTDSSPQSCRSDQLVGHQLQALQRRAHVGGQRSCTPNRRGASR